jgi:hypothetical protein
MPILATRISEAFLNKDSVCYRWKDLRPGFLPVFDGIMGAEPVGNGGK